MSFTPAREWKDYWNVEVGIWRGFIESVFQFTLSHLTFVQNLWGEYVYLCCIYGKKRKTSWPTSHSLMSGMARISVQFQNVLSGWKAFFKVNVPLISWESWNLEVKSPFCILVIYSSRNKERFRCMDSL